MNVIYPAIRSAVYPAVRGALDISEKKQTSEQIIQSLFSQGQQGFWLPFTDFASLSQDSAGTLPYTAVQQPVGRVLDRSGRGNHASQVTSTARGVVSARVNMLEKTNTIGVTPWALVNSPTADIGAAIGPDGSYSMTRLTKAAGLPNQRAQQVFATAANAVYEVSYVIKKINEYGGRLVVFNGAVSVALGSLTFGWVGSAPVVGSLLGWAVAPTVTDLGNGHFRITASFNSSSYTTCAVLAYVDNTLGASHYLGLISIRPATQSALPYQRVNTSTDYDAVGQPKFLTFDGVDDRLQATLPAITGTWIVGYKEGTLVYKVAIPAGAFPIGTNTNAVFYTPSKNFVGMVLRAGDLTDVEVSVVERYLVANGAGAAGVDAFAGVSSFNTAWLGCTSLTSFPLINTAAGTDFSSAWYLCSSLTSFPLINTASGTNFYAAWYGCTSITSFPLINTAAGTNFFVAWYGCTSLTSFPLINTAAGTNFSAAWSNCSSLTSFPLINTAAGTNFNAAWKNCSQLTSFPLINTAAGTNFSQAWQNCTRLTSFPANMFDSCQATNFTDAFQNCALSQVSVDGILASLVTAGKSNGTLNMHSGTSATPSVAGLASKATLVSRGWTVTHN